MRILITGASGFLGSHVAMKFSSRHDVLGIIFRKPDRFLFPFTAADLTDDHAVSGVLTSFRPEMIVHSAAMSRVLDCERNPDQARAINVGATVRLIRWAESFHAKLIFISSDQVYSGTRGGYRESDQPAPINVYGRTKLEAEAEVLSSRARHLVVRSNSIVGSALGGGESFSMRIIEAIRLGETLQLFQDQYRSPIHVRKLVEVIEGACYSEINGLLNVGGPERLSRLDAGYAVLRACGLSPDGIEPVSYLTHPDAAFMTRDTSYDISQLHQRLPDLIFRSLDDEFRQDAEESGKSV